MTQVALERKLNKTAAELEHLVRKSRRKLLEFEVAAATREYRKGKYETFRKAADLLRRTK